MADQQFTPEELATEEWRSVDGYQEVFIISSLGRLIRIGFKHKGYEPRILKSTTFKNGYPYHLLKRSGQKAELRRVHRLVADAFLGSRPDGQEVNHIDGNKNNNRLSNLEYLTHKENLEHASRTGLMPTGKRTGIHTRRERYLRTDGSFKSTKLLAADVVAIRRRLLDGVRPPDIAKEFNVTRMVVSMIKLGKQWQQVEPLREDVKNKLGKPWTRANSKNTGYCRQAKTG